jgi:ADP-heptose:LPS heptosyltransferase
MSVPDILKADEVRLYRKPGGLGDSLFLSTVAREIRKRRPGMRVVLETHWQQLFHHNPDVAATFPANSRPRRGAIEVSYEDPWPPREERHVLRIICEGLGLGEPELRTYYYPTPGERIRARSIRPSSPHPLVVVHPFNGFFAARSKQWDFRHWKRFLELIPPEIETIRFGGAEDPATPTERPNHREVIGLDLRLIAPILEGASVFVGQESGLAHLATALGVPSVVIFTGFVPPSVFGYAQNVNLAPELPYAPCWQKDGCPPCRAEICTRAVQPETVLQKMLEVLGRRARRDRRRFGG